MEEVENVFRLFQTLSDVIKISSSSGTEIYCSRTPLAASVIRLLSITNWCLIEGTSHSFKMQNLIITNVP